MRTRRSVQLESSVLAVSPPRFLCTLSLLTGGGGWETEKALTLYRCCSAIAKVLVCYQHFLWSQILTIVWHNILRRKVTLFHPKPIHKHNPQRSGSGSIHFLSFLTLGIQKDVHTSTEKLIGDIVYMRDSGFHLVPCCEPRMIWEAGVELPQRWDWWYVREASFHFPAPTELLSDNQLLFWREE